MAATVTFEADLSSAVRQFIELARRAKESGVGIKDLTTAVGQLSREVVKGSKEEIAAYKERSQHLQALAKDVAQLTQIEKLQAAAQREASEQFKSQKQAAAQAYAQSMRQVYDEWKASQKAFDEGAAAGGKLAKSGELVNFAMSGAAKSIHQKGQAAGITTVALSGLSGRITQMLGPMALLDRGIQFVTSALREQVQVAEDAAMKLANLGPSIRRVLQASGGAIRKDEAVRKQGIGFAAGEGLTTDQGIDIAAKAAMEGFSGAAFAKAAGAGQLEDPVRAMDTYATINQNLKPGQRISPDTFVNQVLATAKAVGATPGEVVDMLEKAGPSLLTTGASTAEFAGIAAAVGERTGSSKQAKASTQKLAERLSKGFELKDAGGSVLKSGSLTGAGIIARVAEADRDFPGLLDAEAAGDNELAIALAEARGPLAAQRTRDIAAAGRSGSALRAADIAANASPVFGPGRQLRKSQAAKDAALEERGVAATRFQTSQAALDAEMEARGIDSLGKTLTRWGVGMSRMFYGDEVATQQAQSLTGATRGGENPAINMMTDGFKNLLSPLQYIGELLGSINSKTPRAPIPLRDRNPVADGLIDPNARLP